MENQEALKTHTLVTQFPNLVQDKVNDLLANGVVPSGIVIGSIFLACDELLRVEELAVGASANFINDCGLQVYKHCPGHMLASAHLTEEGVDRSHLLPQWSCHLASGHRAECRVPGNRAPSRHCQSGKQPGQHGDAFMHGCCFVAARQMVEKRRGCCFL